MAQNRRQPILDHQNRPANNNNNEEAKEEPAKAKKGKVSGIFSE